MFSRRWHWKNEGFRAFFVLFFSCLGEKHGHIKVQDTDKVIILYTITEN